MAAKKFQTNFSCISNINYVFLISMDFKFAKNWQNFSFRRLLNPAGAQLALFFPAYKEYDCSF